jgi:hypothetical protein
MLKTLLTTLASVLSLCCFSQVPNTYDIVIDEIMFDPSPQVGLPSNEWIELKNTTSTAINLQGWRIGDATGSSGTMAPVVLQPDSFLIVCTSSAVTTMSSFGRTISVTSFPSLNNTGDRIYLQSSSGKIIHAVDYLPSWLQDPAKEDGGWTLEMIDPKNPCGGMSNWKASIHPSGGTPGKTNSVDGVNPDNIPPQLVRTYTTDSVTIIAVFNEPLDSASANTSSNYKINNLSPAVANVRGPVFNTVELKFTSPLQKNTVYELSATGVKDCKGNLLGVNNKAQAGLASEVAPLDIVINEILFNPKPTQYDYVELYNKSNKIIDANTIYIANRNTAGTISSSRLLSAVPFFIYPGEYVVVTENVSALQMGYLVLNPANIITISSLPSYPDDKGIVVITNEQQQVIDEVPYSENWHFALLDNKEGVALERVNPSGSSTQSANWHSASSTAGYGTPTYRNSQFMQDQLTSVSVEVTPKIFSPDNDGYNDIATISYHVDTTGYVANVIVFDAGGRIVRKLVKNDLAGYSGTWNWDGFGENHERLAVGTYVVYTEFFNLQGKRKVFKNSVVLARRLH